MLRLNVATGPSCELRYASWASPGVVAWTPRFGLSPIGLAVFDSALLMVL
jgi:hypothetical protein